MINNNGNNPQRQGHHDDEWYAVAFGIAYKLAESGTNLAVAYTLRQCREAGTQCNEPASTARVSFLNDTGIKIQMGLLFCGTIFLIRDIHARLRPQNVGNADQANDNNSANHRRRLT